VIAHHHKIMVHRFYNKTPWIRASRNIIFPANSHTCQVSLKLDALQVSGSFKDRGISHMMRTLAVPGINHVISSSGGNAGLAAATAAERLGLQIQVFVPETALPLMINKIKSRNKASVIVKGANWNEANGYALEAMDRIGRNQTVYIPPYDHPLIWEGNSTLVDEILEDCGGDPNKFPKVIVLSVGGGGLLRGVQLGLERLGLAHHTQIFAVETHGTASFAAGKKAGKVVYLDKINSIATSLGALSVVPSCLTSPVRTTSFVVSDAEAVDACYDFLNEHRILVEPACGAALAMTNPRLREAFSGIDSALFVVCGGSAINLEMLAAYRQKVGSAL
jgi:L-serine/L-threonine ammonia-lyase